MPKDNSKQPTHVNLSTNSKIDSSTTFLQLPPVRRQVLLASLSSLLSQPQKLSIRSFSTEASSEQDLTHIEDNKPTMVDVGNKKISQRTAQARCVVTLPDALIKKFKDGDINSAKGPIFATAIIAGTMGAKKTSSIIPFCHPINIDSCKIDIKLNNKQQVIINCTVKVDYKTGVEMEALTGCSIAALTIYDMCKAVSHNIKISNIELVSKSGGKSDFVNNNNNNSNNNNGE